MTTSSRYPEICIEGSASVQQQLRPKLQLGTPEETRRCGLHSLTALFLGQNRIYYYYCHYLLIYLLTANELSLCGSSPYTSTDKTNKNKINGK